jgi:hypothetical protein
MKYKILCPLKDTTTLAEALWVHEKHGFDYDVDTHSFILAEIEYIKTNDIAKNIFKNKLDHEE